MLKEILYNQTNLPKISGRGRKIKYVQEHKAIAEFANDSHESVLFEYEDEKDSRNAYQAFYNFFKRNNLQLVLHMRGKQVWVTKKG